MLIPILAALGLAGATDSRAFLAATLLAGMGVDDTHTVLSSSTR